ncbi:MAG TPA: SDR family NAD(P)-dependent oxidoreductase [Gaiellaceae bacterium]|nr:SDR family NAD(P)-dependent oxidoreductase [Gaiellaceae bacterium]
MAKALVTGGGRGIGANMARWLARDGWDVWVAARSRDQVDAVAEEIGGHALELDVTDDASVARAFDAIGELDLLCANAGAATDDMRATFEVNVFGVRRCCEAALERGVKRIVITGSGSSYLPNNSDLSYGPSKAAVGRYAENLNNALDIPVFLISPGLVKTEMTSWAPEDAPWTPPELAPELVRKLATGKYDALAGRYIHAEHDDVDDLLARADEIRDKDLNAVRLQR